MVHTGTYQYVPVQHGIRQYDNFTVVRTGMYRYIPVRTFNKTSCFLTHPERVRRDQIKVVQLLCMGYNVTKSNFKTAQVQSIHGTYRYILVHTGTYRYRRKPNSTLALEEELGACIPTVFKGNIVYIFCDAVRIWRDHDNAVLHTPQPLSTGTTM